MIVERSLGLLKSRFRKLKTMMDIDRVVDLPQIIVAACTLHTFSMMLMTVMMMETFFHQLQGVKTNEI